MGAGLKCLSDGDQWGRGLIVLSDGEASVGAGLKCPE